MHCAVTMPHTNTKHFMHCSIGMSHMAECTCCSSGACERPNENTFTLHYPTPRRPQKVKKKDELSAKVAQDLRNRQLAYEELLRRSARDVAAKPGDYQVQVHIIQVGRVPPRGLVNVNVNVNELRLGFSNTTRNFALLHGKRPSPPCTRRTVFSGSTCSVWW